KGRLFALTRDELAEAMALVRAVRAGRLDAIPIPEAPLDVLAQQIVAELAARETTADELFALVRRAWPYRNLSRDDFDRMLDLLAGGIPGSGGGRRRAWLHYDRVNGRLRARKGARIVATSNAGAIPEVFSYRVVAEPERTVVGTLDEDFSIESNRGDIFLLGNTSWRIVHVRGGDVTVVDAHGAPPTIPFWRGEAPGRTFELSEEVSRLREDLEARIADSFSRDPAGERSAAPPPVDIPTNNVVPRTPDTAPRTSYTVPRTAADWLAAETSCAPEAARQIVEYFSAQKAAIGLLPTQRRIVFERFFDETGGMQVVVHAPLGSGITRAWALALRKRFCRSFDFELQASADDDGFILSIGPQHSFPLESLFAMVTRANARPTLEQALLAAPVFPIRWRWNVTRALLVQRRRGGQKVPPPLQRFRSDDLLSAVFPRLTGCQEEHTGDIDIPDHPLVRQTMDDCLSEYVDLTGFDDVLGQIERGEIALVARDTREPSPFCYEILNAMPYAFLDGGEIQEQRTRAVSVRRTLSVDDVRDLGRLDPEAIAQVRREARPLVRSADELHDVLLSRIVLPLDELDGFDIDGDGPSAISEGRRLFGELRDAGRAAELMLPDGRAAWVAAERWPAAQAVFPEAHPSPTLTVPESCRREWPSAEARTALVGGLLEICGPTTANDVARRLAITPAQADAALEALEGEGAVLRGRFTPSDPQPSTLNTQPSPEWCHRRLLARIHRLTLAGLRRQIEPVSVDVYIRFLARLHGVAAETRRRGSSGLFECLAMLQGLDLPAIAWERDVLPARLENYDAAWLDELCLNGEVGWARLYPRPRDPSRSRPMASLTRVVPVSLFLRTDSAWLPAPPLTKGGPGGVANATSESLSTPAQQVLELLHERGPLFAADLLAETRMLPAHLDDALGELVSRGLVTADGFAGLRRLIAAKREGSEHKQRRRRPGIGLVRKRNASAGTGRWSIAKTSGSPRVATRGLEDDDHRVEFWAWQLLRRWGVVYRDLLVKEAGAPPWYELVRVYRRLEARGEIRGGRFIAGVGGEQFASSEAVAELRRLRDEPPAHELLVLSAADPLNLVGVITRHARVPATTANRIALMDGVPVARLEGGRFETEDAFARLPADVQHRVLVRFGQKSEPVPDELETEEAGERRRPLAFAGVPRPMIS
ncbi:MAG: DEAD/DEAH box helicase, partial [Planctomycetes bacterium]|nr:DEAD/DEAH box helicase [Planctomycetota bacterium]